MSRVSTAAIVAVGSELLTPFRVDTNSLFITEQLNRLGIEVVLKMVAGDDRDQLAYVLGAALVRADLVVLSGGLGPTDDDVTREVVAHVLKRPLAEDPARTEALRARFKARGFSGPMPEINRRQAMVPAGARVIENDHGSAPGLWLEDGTRVVVLLPGPPRELKPMLTGTVVGWLADRAPGVGIERRVLRIARMVESQVEQRVQPLYREWAEAAFPVSATILAAPGQVDLHLSVRAAADVAREVLDRAAGQVTEILGSHVYSVDGGSLEETVGEALAARSLRLAVAESCTGGLIASRLTDVPGSSRYLEEGVVAYANHAKMSLLSVPETLLAEHGAVSEAVARAMAEGIRQHAGADVGLGVTGIAGPGGGSAEKPVGSVAIAVTGRGPDEARSRLFRFPGERDRVKFQASQAALDMVRRMVLGLDEPY
jgi:nicotinamide-nucleotide amidase